MLTRLIGRVLSPAVLNTLCLTLPPHQLHWGSVSYPLPSASSPFPRSSADVELSKAFNIRRLDCAISILILSVSLRDACVTYVVKYLFRNDTGTWLSTSFVKSLSMATIGNESRSWGLNPVNLLSVVGISQKTEC